jgi:uncharacterized protein YbjT (DUF2867 family)
VIVLTAPTGDIGHQVLEHVIETDETIRVIARDPSKISARVHERVEVVEGSLDDPDVLDRAFDGADTIFWLMPPDPKASSVHAAFVDFSRPAAQAITRHHVQRLVVISALGRGVAHDAGYVDGTLAMEDQFASTGVNMRTLSMPSFMDNIARQARSITGAGEFYSPISGDLKLPSVATRDIATAAARFLLDHSWTGQENVPVLGPENISFNDMAEIMTTVLGRPVRFQQISPEAYKVNFVGFGMSDAMAQGMLDMALAKDAGIDLDVKRTPENSTPTTFAQWSEDVLVPALGVTASAA